MGTKVQIENCLPGQSSTRDLSHESNGGGWPSCYTDGSLPKGRFHYSYLARTIADSHLGYDKDVLKQTMLEHEAIFKDQVYELHRLYRVQRGLMDEVKRKDPLTWSMPNEASSSSSPLPSHLQFDGAQRWNGSSYPLASPSSGRPLISGPDFVQSSPNSMKGKSILVDPSTLHNCYSPKISEASEFRPTKFRKRILDLQLPAEEYIDTDEVEQFGCSKDLHISKRKALADLNEPLHVEETITFSAFGSLGHSGSHSDASYRDLPAKLLNSSKDTPHNSKKLSLNGTSHNLPEIQANGQDWFGNALGSEQSKAFVRSINQEVKPEKAPVVSRPVQILTSEHIKREPWKTNSNVLSQNSDYHFLGFHVSSQAGLSWNQSAWGKPNLPTSKPISIQPSLFQSSLHSNDFFGKRDQNSSPKPNAAFGSEPPVRNGFRQGSSAAFTELPACFPKAGFDNLNFNYNDNRASINSHNSIKATTCNNVNPVRDINLNDTLPNSVFTDEMEDKDCKPKDALSVLPWLRGKGGVEPRMSENCQKILGVSIFGNPPKRKDPLDNSHQSRYEEVECSKGKHLFDMNLPCDEASDSEVEKLAIDEVVATEEKPLSFRNHFDLNCCMTEEVGTGIDLEALINIENEEILSVENSRIKESEKQPPGVRPENSADDGDAESAASAIVAMSFCVKSTSLSVEERICLPPEAQGDDPLHWFVSIACSTGNDDGLDDFEYMILRLEECTPEEYFPIPSIPDFTIIENSTCMLTSRTRKGQGRRGRQKRDFQRDILPGLTTLSRHEVTEDLQTFGGLMRATGYSWQSRPNRRNAARNGRGRGRRRAVETTLVLEETVCALPLKQQEVHCDLVEVSVVDKSLTGWGKTTRRPRRQRCPAGNHALQVTLT